MELLICAVFVVSAIFLAALGVPLWRGKVPPNELYGFRIPATLDDPGVWYPVNRVAGVWLMVTGAAVTVISVTLYALGVTTGTAAAINLSALFGFTAAVAVHGLIVAARLTKEPRG
ncbi:MAG: SdpI family protein [Phycisphaerales bacterium]|nr:SdpI family protein [Phycisphaerales bacterium]